MKPRPEIMAGFSELDRNLALFMAGLDGGGSEELLLGALLASSRTSAGDICVDISAAAGRPVEEITGTPECPLILPERDIWIARLKSSAAVGAPGEFKPLILDGKGRLYLHRYWRYEQGLASAIAGRAREWADGVDRDLLGEGLDRLFPSGGVVPDWQRVAAMAAVMRSFTVISGGPGTGKTSTVVRILALLAEQALNRGRGLAAALAAPTGKAAARLQDAVVRARHGLPCGDDVRLCIPEEAYTIHRLLRPVAGSPYFHHDDANRLPHDVVIVDESSMADMALMAKLAAALRPRARLILLGDRDQLSSVESGAVLGDICDTGNVHGYSTEFREAARVTAGTDIGAAGARREPPIADSIIVLKKSYRFGADSGIGELSAAVRDGDAERAVALLKGKRHADIALVEYPQKSVLPGLMAERILEGHSPYLSAASHAEAFKLFQGFTVLCALRRGPFGVSGINALAEEVLSAKGIIDAGKRWYEGRPVMVLRNDYLQRLYNGDVGIVRSEPGAGGELRAFFMAQEPLVRRIAPVKLPEHETVYAMTVHKSQGSEFERVVLVLPPFPSPVLTRELVYTAVTRARRSVEIWADEKILAQAVANPIMRTSGLRDALWEQS